MIVPSQPGQPFTFKEYLRVLGFFVLFLTNERAEILPSIKLNIINLESFHPVPTKISNIFLGVM